MTSILKTTLSKEFPLEITPSHIRAIEDLKYRDWQEVQEAFYKLWEVNEKGQDGGYTKVKCEIKFKGGCK